jgi:outer membrane usher protein
MKNAGATPFWPRPSRPLPARRLAAAVFLSVFSLINSPGQARYAETAAGPVGSVVTASVTPPAPPELAPASAEPPAAIDTCLSAIETTERMTRGIPPGLLRAIGTTESGRSVGGDFGPWPWTLNIAGEGRYFASRAVALDAARAAIDTGEGNVDLGCMQISETWHGWAFPGLDAMIDPSENAGYAASLLMSLYVTHGTWLDAIAHYHSGNPARGFAYAERVVENWRQDPEGAAFIAADKSLADVSRLAANLVDLREIDEIEAEYFVTVIVSERYEVATAFAVKDAAGRLYVSLADLAEVPFEDRYSLPLVLYGESVLIDLSDSTAFQARLDEEALLLEMIVRGSAFPTQVSRSGDTVRPEEITPRQPGGHLNYNIAAGVSSDGGVDLSAVLNAVGYWDNKTLRASVLIDDDLSWKRLSTTITIDNFEDRRQLVLGDTTTPGASGWGGSRPVFGLSWGSNLSLDPSFSTLPDYSIFGVTDIPAVARFLVDGEPVRETRLEPGPYEFSDLPFPDQFGDMTVAVEDLQGQVRYFKVPYIRIPNLYREGLHTYNYGIGLEKVASDHPLGGFGGLVAAATHRYGFSDTFTGEIHGEISAGSVALGVTGDFALLETNRFLSATFATSYSALGPGFQAALSYGSIRRDAPSLVSGSLRFTSPDFHLGTSAPSANREMPRFSLRLASSLGGTLPFTLNYDFTDSWTGAYSHSLSAGRSWALSDGWSLSTSGNLRVGSEGRSGALFVGLSKTFGTDRPVHTHFSGNYSNGTRYLEAMMQRPKRSGAGVGYYGRVSGNPDTGWFGNASFGLQGETEKLNYSATGQVTDGSFGLSATLSGSIGFLDGETFLASRLDSPYVLVRSGEARDLPIRLNYNLLGETDSNGVLVGDGLVPFSRNRVEFRPEDLGFDFSMSGVDYSQTVVPASIGGYVAKFPITEQFPATVILVDSFGIPLPSGAIVMNLETEETVGVTMDGMAYFENVGDGHILEADLGRFGRCETVLTIAEDFAKFDEIGPFVCE